MFGSNVHKQWITYHILLQGDRLRLTILRISYFYSVPLVYRFYLKQKLHYVKASVSLYLGASKQDWTGFFLCFFFVVVRSKSHQFIDTHYLCYSKNKSVNIINMHTFTPNINFFVKITSECFSLDIFKLLPLLIMWWTLSTFLLSIMILTTLRSLYLSYSFSLFFIYQFIVPSFDQGHC